MARSTLSLTYIYIYQHYSLFKFPWDSPVTWVVAALATDLGYYWLHRAAHGTYFDCKLVPILNNQLTKSLLPMLFHDRGEFILVPASGSSQLRGI